MGNCCGCKEDCSNCGSVRDQTEQIVKIGPPYTFYFYFCIFDFFFFSVFFFCYMLQ